VAVLAEAWVRQVTWQRLARQCRSVHLPAVPKKTSHFYYYILFPGPPSFVRGIGATLCLTVSVSPVIHVQSAGTMSPLRRRMTSPGTSSDTATWRSCTGKRG
jgi:hypothetical protein